MKKYTKEITALLTLVTAGVIGGSVYAAEAPEEMPPTAGVPIRTEEYDRLTGTIMTTDDDAPETTTPLMGDMMPEDHNPLIINPIAGRGDINGDGVTDLRDLLRLSQYVLGDIKFDEVELIQADMTMDGTVDIADLPAMRMKVMTPDTATPPADDKNSYANMTISSLPDKTQYKTGEPLDLTGTVISACGCTPEGLCWDIFSHKVTLDDTMVQVDASSFNNKVPGTYTITISYKTNYKPCSASFTVTVTDPDPSSVTTAASSADMLLRHGPDKTEYKTGEPLDLSGLLVFTGGVTPEGICWDGEAGPEIFDEMKINVDSTAFNNQVPGTYTIKLSYDCGYKICSATFDVTVTE